jgi:hypothetical protein
VNNSLDNSESQVPQVPFEVNMIVYILKNNSGQDIYFSYWCLLRTLMRECCTAFTILLLSSIFVILGDAVIHRGKEIAFLYILCANSYCFH